MKNLSTNEVKKEQRLFEIRREAETQGMVKSRGIRPSDSPFPIASPETGYYGIPLLKEPSWAWEIPLYFFVGGASGAAAVIGAIADITGADPGLVKHARWIAAAGSVISPALLVSDLGRPERFLNMLRVFKPQSAMSMGMWTLMGFSGGAAASAFAEFVKGRYGPSFPVKVIANAGNLASLAFGLPFSNYTGVLIGVTAIPVWNQHAEELPAHFGASGIGTAVGLLELSGHERSRALQMLGLGAAVFECWEGLRIESKKTESPDPLKNGLSGALIRTGGVLSGPVPLALRLLSMFSGKQRAGQLRCMAAMSTIGGSLITRIAWITAGHVSARNWREPLEIPQTPQLKIKP
jgi:hypothetical protein